MRVCRERSVFGLKRAENDLATVAGLAVNHYDGDAQRMRASIGQNDFMSKQCQQEKVVARTDFRVPRRPDCGFAWSHLHGVIVAGVATGEAGSNLLLVGGECGVPVWVSALEA